MTRLSIGLSALMRSPQGKKEGKEEEEENQTEDLAPVQMQKCIFNRIDSAIKLVLTPLKLISIVIEHKRTCCFKPFLKSKIVLATFQLTIKQIVLTKFEMKIYFHCLLFFSLVFYSL